VSVARAALFDIDGTLVDSVDLHAEAWQEALSHFGKQVPYAAVRAQIGKGGDQLLAALLSPEEQERFGEELDDYRGGLYRRDYLPRVKVFPQARELLAHAKQRGVLVGLASSCNRSELGYYLRMVGGASLVDAATTADDADKSKPHPDIFEACLDRLALDPEDAVAVGDSPYDAEAATRAGLAAVGVRCGGFDEALLREVGCAEIYDGPADLLARFESSLLAPRHDPHPQR
jgi:HAD superfamily hydrolase (TIGR01549 family)